MCTVSWRRERDGYDLFFNRDELHTRAPESPPERGERDGIAFLAPRDGARGGTWLLANERGVTVCLLNDYANAGRPAGVHVSGVGPALRSRPGWQGDSPAAAQAASAQRPRDALSRGEIVLACAAAARVAEVPALVRAQPLARVAAFHLVAIAPGAEPLVLHWSGAALAVRVGGAVSPPLSSSSFATAEVVAARVRRFSAYAREPAAPTADELAAYHGQHDLRAGAHSVLMRRPDAATRSVCRVGVAGDRVRLDYEAVRWDGAGPLRGDPMRLTLPRAEVPLLPKRATADRPG